MFDYRCYFLNPAGRIETRMEFRAKDDGEGVEFARELYALHVDAVQLTCGFELWQGRRMVHQEETAGGAAAAG